MPLAYFLLSQQADLPEEELSSAREKASLLVRQALIMFPGGGCCQARPTPQAASGGEAESQGGWALGRLSERQKVRPWALGDVGTGGAASQPGCTFWCAMLLLTSVKDETDYPGPPRPPSHGRSCEVCGLVPGWHILMGRVAGKGAHCCPPPGPHVLTPHAALQAKIPASGADVPGQGWRVRWC